MKNVKTLVSALLALALLGGCATGEGWLSGLFGSSAPSLRFVSVPDNAFTDPSCRVIAASSDRRNVLISCAYEVYLWDTLENRRLPLTFTDESDIAAFNQLAESAVVLTVTRNTREQSEREKQRDRILEIKASYLNEKGLKRFTSFDHLSECFPRIVSLATTADSVSARYAIADAAQLGASFLVDLETGECRLINDIRYAALCDGRLLTPEGITLLDTGETYLPTAPELDVSGLSSQIKRLTLLKDDSVLALVPSDTMDKTDYSREMYLADISKERSTVLELGRYAMSKEPDRLLVTGDGRYALACGSIAASIGNAVIVDREKGETKPFTERLFLVAAAGDAFICYDAYDGSQLYLLAPDTLKLTKLKLSGLGKNSPLSFMAASSFVGNGEGLYFVQNDIVRGYFEFAD